MTSDDETRFTSRPSNNYEDPDCASRARRGSPYLFSRGKEIRRRRRREGGEEKKTRTEANEDGAERHKERDGNGNGRGLEVEGGESLTPEEKQAGVATPQ